MRKQNSYMNARHQQYQQGVVLFIALVALVVMSLAAAALIRNVDTNTKIAGNLSFQQSALTSSSRGAESAMAWLETQSIADLTALYTPIAANTATGYYATYEDLGGAGVNLGDSATLRSDATWTTYSAVATGSGITAGKDNNTKNTINYIIERMCSNPVKPANDVTNKCLTGPGEAGGGSQAVVTSDEADGKPAGAVSPIYRVTVRVTGPKNTRSYSQVYAY
ncbi:MAG: hypothetical protein V3U89_07585 [Methylophilaceae bacterium]